MAIDLTVVAIPFYLGSMAAEHRFLKRRTDARGASSADYEAADTRASLTMGLGSLVIPLATRRFARHVVPGKGRYAKVLIGAALGAAAVTTVADRLAGHELDELEDPREEAARPQASRDAPRRSTMRRLARRVRRVSGPVAMASGALVATTWLADRTSPQRLWAKGEANDRGGGPLALAAAVAGWDLIYYWNHRLAHEVRGIWAIHVVHHSSERYNLSTALRQPVADLFGAAIPYGLLARAGIRPSLIEQARGINLLYQYWIHTDAIRSIGPAEEVLNTPSHHRAHHGSNRKYLDRNHGSILIVWDRLFGTFQREEEPVVYGLTKNIETFDPVRIAGHEYVDIVRDISRSTTWRDRLGFVLRSPGWAYDRAAERATGGAG